MPKTIKNWSGLIASQPAAIFYPESEEEISNIVNRAARGNRKIRVIGSGHSFSALIKTDQFLVSLDKYQGIISINNTTNEVTVKAGTKLNRLNGDLAKEGLALANMGDIDVQSIAGAISTGTHGTGMSFGTISTFITKIKFINGLGELVTCSESKQPELFKSAQVSLGALGIITELTLQCVPSYNLELKVEKRLLEEVLDDYPKLNKTHRNFEFFWFPNTPYVMTKGMDITTSAPRHSTVKTFLKETVMENYAFKLINEMAYYFPSMTRGISKFAASTTEAYTKINQSHKVFSTPRLVKFNEMEYNVPIEVYAHVKKEIVNWVNKNNYDVLFPLENRFVKGDDIYLSPAYKRKSAYIAVHVYNKKDFRTYFKALESIFKDYGGRPHWGKMHNLQSKDFEVLYPKFSSFNSIRGQQDPKGLFLSPYLESLFK